MTLFKDANCINNSLWCWVKPWPVTGVRNSGSCDWCWCTNTKPLHNINKSHTHNNATQATSNKTDKNIHILQINITGIIHKHNKLKQLTHFYTTQHHHSTRDKNHNKIQAPNMSIHINSWKLGRELLTYIKYNMTFTNLNLHTNINTQNIEL